MRWIPVDGSEPSGPSIHVYECGSLDVIAPLPVNREGGLVFFDVEWFGVPIAGQAYGELIRRVKQPRIARFGGEQDKLTNRDDAPIMLGSPAQDVANFVGETLAPVPKTGLDHPAHLGCPA